MSVFLNFIGIMSGLITVIGFVYDHARSGKRKTAWIILLIVCIASFTLSLWIGSVSNKNLDAPIVDNDNDAPPQIDPAFTDTVYELDSNIPANVRRANFYIQPYESLVSVDSYNWQDVDNVNTTTFQTNILQPIVNSAYLINTDYNVKYETFEVVKCQLREFESEATYILFNNIPAGNYEVFIDCEGYSPKANDLELPAENIVDLNINNAFWEMSDQLKSLTPKSIYKFPIVFYDEFGNAVDDVNYTITYSSLSAIGTLEQGANIGLDINCPIKTTVNIDATTDKLNCSGTISLDTPNYATIVILRADQTISQGSMADHLN